MTAPAPAAQIGFDFSKLPEEQRIAAYGMLFAVAACDGNLSQTELQRLFETVVIDALSEDGRRTVASYIAKPPKIKACLKILANAEEAVRFGLVMSLVDVAMIDGSVSIIEHDIIQTTCETFGISQQQLNAMKDVARKAHEVANAQGKDPAAVAALEAAIKGLGAVGVPITAVYFSGTVIGLSAAGITSGLAGILGLGVGMLPGLGIAVLLGVGAYWGISKAFGLKEKRADKERRAQEEKKAQLVVRNLQRVIDELGRALDTEGKISKENRAAIQKLADRLSALKQTVTARAAA